MNPDEGTPRKGRRERAADVRPEDIVRSSRERAADVRPDDVVRSSRERAAGGDRVMRSSRERAAGDRVLRRGRPPAAPPPADPPPVMPFEVAAPPPLMTPPAGPPASWDDLRAVAAHFDPMMIAGGLDRAIALADRVRGEFFSRGAFSVQPLELAACLAFECKSMQHCGIVPQGEDLRYLSALHAIVVSLR